MNNRVANLRFASLNIEPHISIERAQLLTEFYREKNISNYSIPVQRAMAFKYILENKLVVINDGELMLARGERVPKQLRFIPSFAVIRSKI